MSTGERLLWSVTVGVILFWLLIIFRGWRRWSNNRTRKRLEDAAREAAREDTARRESEGHGVGHVAARYRRRDRWLEKIGYYRKGRKSNPD